MISLANNRPVTVLMVTLGLCILGVLSWQRLPMQLLPQFVFPEVQINTAMPDAFPEQLEREAVILVEAEVATLNGVHEIESQVSGNFANTTVVFDQDVDMKFALLKLQQKMNALQAQLPQDARVTVERFDTADLATFLMQISIRGEISLDDLREIAERRVRSRLEQVDGVVNVVVGGGRRSTVGVFIDPDRCEALNIPVTRVQEKINAYHQQPTHVGRVMTEEQWLDVNLAGRIDDLAELRALLIDSAIPVRLDQVAVVEYSTEKRTEFYRVDGKSSVGIFIQKDNISNMLAVGAEVLAEIDRLNQELAVDGIELVVGANQAEFIQNAINQLEQHALTGLVLALIVLFLFLHNIRFVAILVLAIPVSLLVTFNLMYGGDLSVNILSLCGLALAIGMLVDNGIVVLENVFRRFQHGEASRTAAIAGTREMSRSIFAATGTTVLVFLPVLFVESQARLLIRELALSVIFPLVVSLIVAMTVIPLLAGRVLEGRMMRPFGGGRLLEIYRILLKVAIRHRIHTIVIVVVLFVMSMLTGMTVILSRAPAPPPDRLDVYITVPKGTTLDATDKVVRRVEEQIAEFPDLKEFRTNVRPEEAQIAIGFVDVSARTEPLRLNKLKNQLSEQSRRLSGVTIAFAPPRQGGGRVSRGDDLSGILSTSRGLRLRGYDMETLRQLSEQIVQTLRSIPEIEPSTVRSDLQIGKPEIQIWGDRDRLARAGMTMASLMQMIPGTRPEGMQANAPFHTTQGDVNIRLVVLGMEESQPKDIENLKIQNAAGQSVPLREMADVRLDEGEGNIVRHNQERQVRISYDFISEVMQSKPRLDQTEAQIIQLVDTFRLPAGFVLEHIQPENEQAVYYWILGIGAVLIYMFLAAQFESFLSPLVILGTVPTAIIGGAWALILSGTPLSLGEGAPMALLGMIVLLGIVVNNGIILLDRIAVLRRRQGYRWQRAVIAASQQRVRPIVMTSVTTMLGVFPLALKQGAELELWPPFAITILGGLAVSTFSTLVFIPVLYVGLEQTKAWCKQIGWEGLTLGTIITGIGLASLYLQYPSKLYVGLLVLPFWFLVLGVIYGVRHFMMIRREKAEVTDHVRGVRIRNLTKVYGAPGRFRRDWRKQRRRIAADVRAGRMPWKRQNVVNISIWMVSGGVLLAFLHTFVDHGLWITTISLITLGWLFGMREIWYTWCFVQGRPPQHGRRRWMSRLPGFRRPAPPADGRPVTLLDFPRRGGSLFILLFLAYLHLRLQISGLTGVATIISLLLYLFYRIGRRIESGVIDPDQPAGRLQKVKRMLYNLVRIVPVIRPSQPQVTALNGVTLDIGQGMFGLLGPNGAGKTTLMRILVGVLEEDRGSIFVNDRKLTEDRELFHAAIGYLPQDFGLYGNMTPYAYLENHALTNGIYETSVRRRLIDDVLHGVGLWERRHDKIQTFSGGMKQRVGIAQTLLHLPQIIVVDEPTAGLDPRERIRFRNLLAELAKDRIVIFSTHIVEDVASTCHDLAVLFEGKVLYRGSPETLQRRADGKVFEANIPEDSFDLWRQRLRIVNHSKTGHIIRLRFVSENPEELTAQGHDARTVPPTLEDAYVYLLQGKQIQDAGLQRR